ncbi:glycoside hydrolase family 3 protein [Lacticaseibacillus jixiensis]|uniref:glycoside hydrolase family 3 protein n=1 Tax=Lacticaseibacillus jixiensis TaxID=3231926 RepID=UPI0036F231C3
MFHWAKWALVAAIAAGVVGASTQKVQAVGETKISDAQLKAYIDGMSEDEQIGQLFISRTPQSPQQGRQAVAKYHLGGLVLFGTDFEAGSAEQLKQTVQSYQAQAKVPLLIATDQEGGTVSRLSSSPSYANSTFPSPQEAYQAGGMSSVLYQAELAAQDLHYIGVNWNFAPIADVAKDPNNYIYDRTFGKSYKETAEYIKQVVPAMQSQGVGATLKHFPGYGAAGDTHTGFAKTTTAYDTLAAQDLLPFKAGIDAGVDGIMVTHIVMTAIDNKYPASLSHKVITGVLRKKLGYKGVIITDGLEMGAIGQFKKANHIPSIDVLALQAGDDALLAEDYATGVPAIKKALAEHKLSHAQIKAADLHLLQLKNKLGLLEASAFIKPNLAVAATNTTKSATIAGALQDPSVKAGTKLLAQVAGHTVASAVLAQDGKFSFDVPLKAKPQRVVVRVAKLHKTLSLPAKGNHQTKKAVAAAKPSGHSLKDSWPLMVVIGGVVIVLFGIVLLRRRR